MIEFKIKEYRNIEPSKLFLSPFYELIQNIFNTSNPDLWGSIFLSDVDNNFYLYDFNLVTQSKDNKTVSLYAIKDGLIQTNKYITWNLIEIKTKNRKYKNLNNSEYLDKDF